MKSVFIQISDELFLKIGNLITARYGIRMPLEKKVMFQARMQRRLRELELDSFDVYAKLLFGSNDDSTELSILADHISTNKTEFFREKDHFTFLTDQALPEYLDRKRSQVVPEMKFWSAGCSNGQEAYSIAVTIEEFMRLKHLRMEYSIYATDISGRMLRSAKEAIYPISNVDLISLEIKQRYFLKSKNQHDVKVRLIKNIREKVKPAYLNLMDEDYQLNDQFDVIFLRNTLIYFNMMTQQRVLTKVLNCLKTGGYLLIGHSESLINMNLPIQPIAPSVYVKI